MCIYYSYITFILHTCTCTYCIYMCHRVWFISTCASSPQKGNMCFTYHIYIALTLHLQYIGFILHICILHLYSICIYIEYYIIYIAFILYLQHIGFIYCIYIAYNIIYIALIHTYIYTLYCSTTRCTGCMYVTYGQ